MGKNTKVSDNTSNTTSNEISNDSRMYTHEVIDNIFYKLYKKVSSDLRIGQQKSFERGVKEIVNQCRCGIKGNLKNNLPEDTLKDVSFAINTVANVVKRNRRQAIRALIQSEYIDDFLKREDTMKLIETFEELQECTDDNIENILITIKTTIDTGVEVSNRELKERYG
uniref:CRISPR type III A-associated protein Csm2 n=1 Tax=Strongyloides papillosus TaxID=174720 RepID=A0A0N5BIR3_STREA